MRTARQKSVALLLSLGLLAGCRAHSPAAEAPRVDMLGSMDEDAFMALHELKPDEPLELGGAPATVPVPGHGPMQGYLSLPPGHTGGALPCVVVIHEWWGLNDNVRLWTDRLANEGYAALAVDLYEGAVATTPEDAMAAMRAVDGAAALARLVAAHDWLVREHGGGDGPSASIGWCFGGGWSLALALNEPELDGAVVYYGRTEVDPELAAAMHARVLGIFAERDQGITPEYVDGLEATLREAGADFRFERYDADHAFGNPSSARYDHEAASAAWERTRAFLAEVLANG